MKSLRDAFSEIFNTAFLQEDLQEAVSDKCISDNQIFPYNNKAVQSTKFSNTFEINLNSKELIKIKNQYN